MNDHRRDVKRATVEQLERAHARLMRLPLSAIRNDAARDHNARECLRIQIELDKRAGKRWTPPE